MNQLFPEIRTIPYEGPKSKNPLAFRWYNPDEILAGKPMREHLRFIEGTPANVVAYTLDNHAGGDEYEQIVVAFNGNDKSCVIPMPQGKWHVLVDNGKIDLQGTRQVTGSQMAVAPHSALIMAR